MVPRKHQLEGAEWALKTVRQYGLAYLGWQERTGKTLTALLTVENSKATTCLIVTKKRAISGWEETLEQWTHVTAFEVINYESIHKMKGNYDFIILDESHHAISGIGNVSKTWKSVAQHTQGKPILYLSATPYAEHVGLLYNQLRLSSWAPFKKWRNYFDFHRQFGIPAVIYTQYGQQQDRTQFRVDEVLNLVDHLFNWKTRAEVGIEHEPEVNVIEVPMSKWTMSHMKQWREDRVMEIKGHEILGDSDAKVRAVHYQMEGGTLKVSDDLSIFLYSQEKIDYIKVNYDLKTTAIMAHFIKERELLEKELPEALILSSDGHAEGVSLVHIPKLIIYSMSFKTSKHTQRTARQANHNRKTPIIVDVLVADKPGVGKAVYDSVAIKKESFIKSSYERAIR